jgi:adenosylhomocysteine nucleosidase
MIGCVIALESEAEALLSQTKIENQTTVNGKPLYTGKAFGKEVAVCICGVGKVNAAVGAAAVLAKGADILFNYGVAGGLHKKTEVCALYAVEKAVQYDFDITQLEGGEIGTLDGETENFLPLFVPDLPFPRRALGTGDRFNDSPADHALLIRLGADLRDMEGAAIAQVCKSAGVPFVSVKAVSDVYGAGSTTEQFECNLARANGALKANMRTILELIA